MKGKKEENFKINGIDSWIHCIQYKGIKDKIKRPVEYHYHEYIELLYFYDGEGEVWINGTKTDISGNSLIIINSNTAHYVIHKAETSYACIKFLPSVLYDNEAFFLNLKYAYPFMSEKQKYILPYEQTKNSDIRALIDEIIDEWYGMKYGFELAIRADILKIFTAILRLYNDNGYAINTNKLTVEIKSAVLYIADNYSTVNEKEAADVCGFSYNYFSSCFKQVLGINFKDYLLRIKLSEAERMLLATDMSITAIAQETGFSTTSHFISKFKNLKGITPRQFRKLSAK